SPATAPTSRGATTTGARSTTRPITGFTARVSTSPASRSGRSASMSWKFERVAGPYEGPAGGVVRDGDAVVVSTIDEGKLWSFDPKSKKLTEVRRYTNRVNGLARGPNGELYGAQEGGRRLVEFTPDGRVMPVDALLDGKYHNQPSDLTVDRAHRLYFTDPRHPLIPFAPATFPFLAPRSLPP